MEYVQLSSMMFTKGEDIFFFFSFFSLHVCCKERIDVPVETLSYRWVGFEDMNLYPL